MNPEDHKPIGNGKPVPSPGMRKKYLSQWNNHFVSGEGYFVSQLPKAVKTNPGNDLTILGHPKACTKYSLRALDSFLQQHANKHAFRTVSSAEKEM